MDEPLPIPPVAAPQQPATDPQLSPTDAPSAPIITTPNPAKNVFFGPKGLRAGWGMLLFAAIFIGIAQTVGRIVHHLRHLPPNAHSPVTIHGMLISETFAVLFVFLATYIMSRIEKRPFTSYGLAGTRRLPLFFTGLFWGFAFISLLVGTLHVTHFITFDAGHASLHAALKYGAVWAAIFVLVGFFEEILLRGYLQWTLWRGIGFWWAALILSIAFGAIHGKNPGESPVGLFSAGAVGLVFCLAIWYTRSLWWAIGAHAAWDWGQTFVYGASDSGLPAKGSFLVSHPQGKLWLSGGATGPEGSIFILPTLAVMAVVIYLTLRSHPTVD